MGSHPERASRTESGHTDSGNPCATEAPGGFEPPNGGFADLCLTTWLRRRMRRRGAENRIADPRPPSSRAGNRTRTGDPHLGKVVLYQLSYSRTLERGASAATQLVGEGFRAPPLTALKPRNAGMGCQGVLARLKAVPRAPATGYLLADGCGQDIRATPRVSRHFSLRLRPTPCTVLEQRIRPGV